MSFSYKMFGKGRSRPFYPLNKMKTKNSIEVKLEGKIITVSITATSEKRANTIFAGIERLCMDILKADLEEEGSKQLDPEIWEAEIVNP